ncbi:uncharacterized protein LOC133785717 [Humulus lupulus]|uniref:uncharacterized protein LOC133785717 n=1 Tax=Humulus lupulus TaxID=3486 RepID=UPI002B4088CF|nr:uncharacterized protein LOC133785717 [Humulus lupulus]
MEDLDVGGYVNTANLRTIGMLAANQTIVASNLQGLQCEKDPALREELSLIHIEVVEAAAWADAAKKKREQAQQTERVASEELDALFEESQSNTGALGASISGQDDSNMSNPVAKMKQAMEAQETKARASAKKAAKGVPKNKMLDLILGGSVSEADAVGAAPTAILLTTDALLAHWNADLVAEMAMRQKTGQLELEGAMNQWEATRESLAKEVAQAKADRKEAARARLQLEETLSRKEADHKKLVDSLEAKLHRVRGSEASSKNLLEAAEAQSHQDQEKITTLSRSWTICFSKR